MESRKALDIIIVGAGASGCVLARRLVDSTDASVLLLEAGPDLRQRTPPEWHDGWLLPTLPDWGFESDPDGLGATGKLRRGRVLGGTSWLTRFAVRGSAADFDGWAAAGNHGWSFDDILPAFRRLEADAEFGDDPSHGRDGPIAITRYPALKRSAIHEAGLEAFAALGLPAVEDHNKPGSVGVGPMPMSSRNGVRVTSADAYLPADQQPVNLEVRADSMVAKVVVHAGRATAVQLEDGTEIGAATIILAAGAYGSPTILMRSGIGPGDHLRSLDIRVEIDLPGVGANLADHPGVELDAGWQGPAKTGPILHSIATFRSSGTTAGAPDLMFWVTDPNGPEPGFYFDPILLKPESRGSVRLRSADPADTPRITLPGVQEPADLDRLAEGYRRGLELANRPEIRRLSRGTPPSEPGSAADLRRRVIENAWSMPHVVGTCRMGPAPASGDVVDALGRVHGIEGLSVIDASIIPDTPSGFPHIVTIMLAEHLAERISAAR